jgi:hypothetical protein
MGKKRSRVVYFLVILVVISLILAIVIFVYSGASTQARVPGVSVGDTFTFDVTFFWNSSDPNAVIPPEFLETNQTESFRVTITDINGSTLTMLDTWVFKNGTESNSTGLINLESGNSSGGFWAVVAANLGKNDLLHPAGTDGITVNETTTREYPSGARETNYFKLNYQGNYETYGHYTEEGDYYFDRATGMLVELYDKSTFFSANMQGAVLWKIKASNVWVVS